jgi:hypothetical protein
VLVMKMSALANFSRARFSSFSMPFISYISYTILSTSMFLASPFAIFLISDSSAFKYGLKKLNVAITQHPCAREIEADVVTQTLPCAPDHEDERVRERDGARVDIDGDLQAEYLVQLRPYWTGRASLQ